MKIKPVMDSLEAAGADVILVHTGQHYDESMNDVFFDDLGIRHPDHLLAVGSGSHATQTGKVMMAFEPVVERLRPDTVVVVGDVNSTVACAVVSAKAGALVAHVEAGLRSRDWSMPEEVNRVVTDRVSDFLLAPSPDAAENLAAEGYRDDQIHVVGNVMVDTLLSNVDRARSRGTLRKWGLTPRGYGLVTLHRPANVDDPETLAGLVEALNRVAKEIPLLFPVHPRALRAVEGLDLHPGIRLLPPTGYLDFLALQDGAALVLTDSGGLQEETTVLGVPCLTLRENTERPITVSEGTNHVVGRDPDHIEATAVRVLRDPPPARRPALWDGRAGERIASVLLSDVDPSSRPRPTDVRTVVPSASSSPRSEHRLDVSDHSGRSVLGTFR
jgi:UDP-N-acetylglucosamine 2-epimerase (non-hydrolysing)